MAEEQRITHIKKADGRPASVVYKTDESEWPDDIRELSKQAWAAGQDAIKRLLDKGIPAYYLKGKDLVKLYPDGHEEVVKENIIP